jgi:hypothetical protein
VLTAYSAAAPFSAIFFTKSLRVSVVPCLTGESNCIDREWKVFQHCAA